MNSQLISLNVLGGGRASIRLERVAWNAIDDICGWKGLGLNQFCSMIDARRAGDSRTSAFRAYIVNCFHHLGPGKGFARKA